MPSTIGATPPDGPQPHGVIGPIPETAPPPPPPPPPLVEGAGRVYPPSWHFAFVAEGVGIPGRNDTPLEIYFAPVPGREIPREKADLLHAIDEATHVVREAFAAKQPKLARRYFESLLTLAQVGLRGEGANPVFATEALARFKDNVLLEQGARVKSKYLRSLGFAVFVAFLVYAVAAWGLATLPSPSPAKQPAMALVESPQTVIDATASSSIPAGDAPKTGKNGQETDSKKINDAVSYVHRFETLHYYACVLAAAMPGVWVSFAVRRPKVRFEDLARPEEDLLHPAWRVTLVSLLATALALVCDLNVAGISLGNFSTSDVTRDLRAALLFGFACGFCENLLSSSVAPHLSAIVQGLSKTKTAA